MVDAYWMPNNEGFMILRPGARREQRYWQWRRHRACCSSLLFVTTEPVAYHYLSFAARCQTRAALLAMLKTPNLLLTVTYRYSPLFITHLWSSAAGGGPRCWQGWWRRARRGVRRGAGGRVSNGRVTICDDEYWMTMNYVDDKYWVVSHDMWRSSTVDYDLSLFVDAHLS